MRLLPSSRCFPRSLRHLPDLEPEYDGAVILKVAEDGKCDDHRRLALLVESGEPDHPARWNLGSSDDNRRCEVCEAGREEHLLRGLIRSRALTRSLSRISLRLTTART